MTPTTVSAAPLSRPPQRAAPAESAGTTESVLSSLNPLHHIPVVSAVYEHLSGTKAIPAVRILVGAVIAGPLGFVAALADAMLEEATGRTAGGHVVAAIAGNAATAVAAGDTGLNDLAPAASAPPTGVGLSVSTASPSTSRADSRVPDPRAARELARVYLLDLALQHKSQPTQIDNRDVG